MNKELSKYYSAVLKSPGMEDPVKIVCKTKKRILLLFWLLAEKSMAGEESKSFIPADASEDLRLFAAELLSKGNFSAEFAESFRELAGEKPRG